MDSFRINRADWKRRNLHNRLQAGLLLISMSGFLGLLGYILFGSQGLWVMLLMSVIPLFWNPSKSPRLVLRLYRARLLHFDQAPALFALVRELSQRAGLPVVPEIFFISNNMINAFSVGNRKASAVAVTNGLLQSLRPREIVGVLAHEISHIANNDLRVMVLADLITRMASFLSLIGQFLLFLNLPLILMAEAHVDWWAVLLLVFAPQIMLLAQLGLSRTREYDADMQAVQLTDDPEGLASALYKVEDHQVSIFRRLWPGARLPQNSWLRTHPPTEKRVQRLLALHSSSKRKPGQVYSA
ncbi:heat shock protein HtpX [Desulfonatronum thiosulfatophilum]|uniref:Heat shock protein HtpX n=1 Tax=Desulfonatronum thiosulfatophilum TaxID=617002 RepID=A0A1G6E2A5_9BACT|nr:zinc metalloprotease HtpX [Desulfonatronum thiosulfatophilum]SDB51579.1 heat shock protein HtpX [Desulfonatronum thiosulfatophilum]